ncbi:redox-regulated ATPase YchF [candidate division WS5 bacterium]|uniref:Ribosome-binding ATPase YchF n=1 Tax=candidate division WS5 bacterium TaxID=2093353 RepID=A0A419DEK2_9BACT|nr:MAG: redox-regulated ATPase YchF [candidate division WS5 bacterium]
MSLSIGIVGLPNVGKSTLFNALTQNKAEASNYPFCTIDPNVGVVEVPDERLKKLAEVIPTQKTVPAIVEFIDIAGIVKGASCGEGLGNKFLANIRECDAIAEVVRVFTDSNITHVSGSINPTSDMETIKMELVLADLETVDKRVQRLTKDVKGDPKLKANLELIKKIQKELEGGKTARELDLKEKEIEQIRDMNLLTIKPHIYIFNIDEEHLQNGAGKIPAFAGMTEEEFVLISAKIESELNELSNEEKKEYLAELGQSETGLNTLIKKSYELLGLQTFFTAGEKEIKAWTISVGDKAPQAAGVIHTDFEKGFIKAETVSWKNLVDYKGWAGAKSAGKVRLEGKDYVVKDGDVMIFKFNV